MYHNLTPFFHVEKENLRITVPRRMQENHDPDCLGCAKCGKTSYAQRQTCASLSENWSDQVLRENYCTDCSGRNRNQNIGKMYVNESQSGYPKIPVDTQDYVTVLNPRRTGRPTDSARGSMYGCDMIYVEDIPSHEDVNKTKTCGSSKSEVENCGVYTSKHSSEKSQRGDYHKVDDISCSESFRSSGVSERETSAKDQSKQAANKYDAKNSGNCRSNYKLIGKTTSKSNGQSKESGNFSTKESSEVNFGKGNAIDLENYESDRLDRYEKFGQCTGSEGAESMPRKGKGKNHGTEYPKTDSKRESLQRKDIADKTKPSRTGKTGTDDAKRATKSETFPPKDNTRQPKTEESEVLKHERSKVSRGSKRMPRRRAARRPAAQGHHARDSEKQDSSGGVEWLHFVYDSIKTGIVSAVCGIPSYLSIGWSLLVYFLHTIILLILPMLFCTWAFIKNGVGYLWDILPYLKTWIGSIQNKIFRKQKESFNDTTQQQANRSAPRQPSDPLPEADELVSKLLESKDLDAYQILGVSPTATDDEIKRKYRDMAKVVHPDKNAHENASEAFQILQSAFEAIGDEEKRMAYEFENGRKRFEEEMDEFFVDFMEKLQQMKNRIMCHVCGKSHPRLPTDRSIFAARYCSECGVRHSVKEGDVWVETSHMGFKYYCFLSMDGRVYEVTEWGSCQGLFRLKPNSHYVFMSVKSNHHSPWDDMFGEGERAGTNKKKRKSKGKSNKNKKRF